jgi:small subunit ribosomal protein S5
MKTKERFHARRVHPDQVGEVTDRSIHIKRVEKTVKGGRRFSFSALVAAGDGKGHIGYGLGKAVEVPNAMRKASEAAKKTMIRVPLRGTTIPHDVIGRSGKCSVVLKPAAPGTGVIAGSVVRAVVELCGIKDIRTKCVGSSNPQNVLQATLDGLLSLREADKVGAFRGVDVDQIGYQPY